MKKVILFVSVCALLFVSGGCNSSSDSTPSLPAENYLTKFVSVTPPEVKFSEYPDGTVVKVTAVIDGVSASAFVENVLGTAVRVESHASCWWGKSKSCELTFKFNSNCYGAYDRNYLITAYDVSNKAISYDLRLLGTGTGTDTTKPCMR